MSEVFRFFIIFSLFLIITKELKKCTCDKNSDAKAIVDSKFDPKTVAKILPFRTQAECSDINNATASLHENKPLIDPKYTPLDGKKPYDDLIFALVNDPMTVFSMYLGQYFDRKDPTFIIMIFIQIDDRMKFKEVYNSQHDSSFEKAQKKLKKPFRNAFRVWAESNREPEESSIPCSIGHSCSRGQELEDERFTWNEKKRDDLEYVLMKEAVVDSENSIHCYGTLRVGPPPRNLLDDIKENIKNDHLVDLYSSLVNYVKNHDDYLAQKLHDYCDGKDGWSIWIIILSTRRGDPMKWIDNAFKSLYKNVTMKEYIEKCHVEDTVFKDMLIDLADSASASKRQVPPPPAPPSDAEQPDKTPYPEPPDELPNPEAPDGLSNPEAPFA